MLALVGGVGALVLGYHPASNLVEILSLLFWVARFPWYSSLEEPLPLIWE